MLSVAKHLLEADKSQRTWCTHCEEILHFVQDDNQNHVILSKAKDLKVYVTVDCPTDCEILRMRSG